MNINVGGPQIGQWYARTGKDELFQVVGRDDESRTIEIQYFDGDVDEIDAEAWATLPLERTEPPEDSTGPMDDARTDDFDSTETQPIALAVEALNDTESFSTDIPEAAELAS